MQKDRSQFTNEMRECKTSIDVANALASHIAFVLGVLEANHDMTGEKAEAVIIAASLAGIERYHIARAVIGAPPGRL